MRPDMNTSFNASTSFILGAGLSDSCVYIMVYMMLGRYETFISRRHKNLKSLYHAGMKSLSGRGHEPYAGM